MTYDQNDASFEELFQWEVNEKGGVTILGLSSKGEEKERTELIVPSEIDGRPVVAIGKAAFWFVGGRFEKVTLPNGVESIGQGAFMLCGLAPKEIVFPDSLQSVGNLAFWHCEQLRQIKFSNALRSIGDMAFRCCSQLSEVVLREGLQRVGKQAFACCWNLKTLEIPASVCEIGDDLLQNCLSQVTIYGVAGSVAEEYAKQNGIRFKAR